MDRGPVQALRNFLGKRGSSTALGGGCQKKAKVISYLGTAPVGFPLSKSPAWGTLMCRLRHKKWQVPPMLDQKVPIETPILPRFLLAGILMLVLYLSLLLHDGKPLECYRSYCEWGDGVDVEAQEITRHELCCYLEMRRRLGFRDSRGKCILTKLAFRREGTSEFNHACHKWSRAGAEGHARENK